MHNRHSLSLDLKRSTRPSPSQSAAETKVGTVKKGNNGKMWIVVMRSNGKKWSIYTGSKKKKHFGSQRHTPVKSKKENH